MKRSFYLIFIVALLAFGCQTHSPNKSLAEVDSLVVAELYDSAYHVVNTVIEPSGLSPEEKAHYDLLRVQTAILVYKPIESADSILDGVISYYNQHVNHERLADAYYYKALGYSIKHDFKRSILLYKKAEQYAEKSNNYLQRYKIAEGISYINGLYANYNIQLHYARRSLDLSKEMGNKRLM